MPLSYRMEKKSALHDLRVIKSLILQRRDIWRNFSREILDSENGVYIFGAGKIGEAVHNYLINAIEYIDIHGFVDNFSSSSMKDGYKITSFEQASNENPDALFIIAVHDSNAAHEIEKQCSEKNVKHLFYQQCIKLDKFMNYLPALQVDEEKVQTLFNSLSDGKSLNYCIEYLYSRFINAEHYFLTGLIQKEDCRSLADVGSFLGDTYEDLKMYTGNDFDNYYAFEPAAALMEVSRDVCGNDPRVKFFSDAISDTKGSEYFAFHDCNYSTDTLDNLLQGMPVTMIKMDILGFALKALKGGINLISEQRPVLVICCHTEPHELWEIPLWIDSLDLGYTIHLRHPKHLACIAIPTP